MNPPHYIPLVELVPSPFTSKEVVSRTRNLMDDIRQAPVVLNKEIDGFILNRLQYAVIMEAWRLVEDGCCSPEDVDTVVSKGLGLRWSFMGPFETIDLNASKGVRDYCERYGEGITRVFQTMVEPRELRGKTVDIIEEGLRKNVKEEELSHRKQWRDARLAKLAVHKLRGRPARQSKELRKSESEMSNNKTISPLRALFCSLWPETPPQLCSNQRSSRYHCEDH